RCLEVIKNCWEEALWWGVNKTRAWWDSGEVCGVALELPLIHCVDLKHVASSLLGLRFLVSKIRAGQH
ncbi:hypothetical protein V4Y02_23620, partial [Escherichia coli]